jgi:thiamine kinase-like enzyme
VFPRPELISENLHILTNHVEGKMTSAGTAMHGLKFPEILRTHDDKSIFLDAAGEYWRAMSFVENTCTLEKITTLTQAEEVGRVLGSFHALICDLNPKQLHETLPGFHNADNYLARYMQTSHRSAPERAEWRYCFSFVESRQALASVLESAQREGMLFLRAIHGDTKLNNFLFDVNSGKAVSLVDLDTIQPGLIHFDIGDCLRSCANTAGESPTDIETVYFDLDICHALLASYLSETQGFLTRHDYRFLYDSMRLIPFELGMRFLTDHLEGNRYFRTDWPGQNLHRAMVQFRLTESIEKSEKRIRSMIDELTPGL